MKEYKVQYQKQRERDKASTVKLIKSIIRSYHYKFHRSKNGVYGTTII